MFADTLAVGSFTNGAPPEIVVTNRAANDLTLLPSAPFCPGNADGGAKDAH
jgi:hypothetical protein